MKKVISLIALVMAVIMVLCACGDAAGNATTTGEITTSGTTTASTEVTTTSSTTPKPPQKTIKILSIGNSFSDDATHWLGRILMDMGYSIYLGNLYIGGCSIDRHWENAQSGEKAYDYRVSQLGSWKSTKQSLEYGLTNKDWDIITIQQVSQDSGRPETFGNLQNMINYINSKKTNPDAKIYWHMTWAYQQDTTHSGFANYGSNQMNMYNSITGAVESTILTNSAFSGFLPSGTTIQNLRTSYLGDTLTRDGYHLSYGIGRYAAALTWAKMLTGEDISTVDYVPAQYPEIADHLDAIKEAVNNACAEPLKVTQSKLTENPNGEPEVPKLPAVVTDLTKTEALTDDDKAFLTSQGVDPNKYAVLKMTPVVCAYYYSTNGVGLTKDASNSPQFWATGEKFSANEIPVGSIITIASGYQYRPEGWQTLTGKNTATRPGNFSTATVKVNANWWNGYSYRAFNVSKTAGGNVSADDTGALRIYVPIAE